MTTLADAVLPLIRTRSELYRWGAANAHGRQIHEAVDILGRARPTADPDEFYDVTHRALTSAIKVVARADDSSGIIGDACRRLLDLHPTAATAASVPPARLVDWMIKFQFDDEVDYFTLDPVAYAPALGEAGIARYRDKLNELRARFGSETSGQARWAAPHAHERFVLEWNAQRLAVLDRDIDAIVLTHAKDRKVAAWLEDTAEALEEIGEPDLAIDWARRAAEFDRGHQSLKAADYWCTLLAQHRPTEELEARLWVFRRWPSSTTGARLNAAAGREWPDYHDEVLNTLKSSPRDAVLFALLTLHNLQLAWDLANSLGLHDKDLWERLAKEYAQLDPPAVLPILAELVDAELTETGAQHYRIAAQRLKTMRRLAAGTNQAEPVDTLIVELRETHRRRPRLQQEFDRANLP